MCDSHLLKSASFQVSPALVEGNSEDFNESRCFLVLYKEHLFRSHSRGAGAPIALGGDLLLSPLYFFPLSF